MSKVIINQQLKLIIATLWVAIVYLYMVLSIYLIIVGPRY